MGRGEGQPNGISHLSFPTRRSTWHFQRLDCLCVWKRGWRGAESAQLPPPPARTLPARLPLGQKSEPSRAFRLSETWEEAWLPGSVRLPGTAQLQCDTPDPETLQTLDLRGHPATQRGGGRTCQGGLRVCGVPLSLRQEEPCCVLFWSQKAL